MNRRRREDHKGTQLVGLRRLIDRRCALLGLGSTLLVGCPRAGAGQPLYQPPSPPPGYWSLVIYRLNAMMGASATFRIWVTEFHPGGIGVRQVVGRSIQEGHFVLNLKENTFYRIEVGEKPFEGYVIGSPRAVGFLRIEGMRSRWFVEAGHMMTAPDAVTFYKDNSEATFYLTEDKAFREMPSALAAFSAGESHVVPFDVVRGYFNAKKEDESQLVFRFMDGEPLPPDIALEVQNTRFISFASM